MDDQRGHDREVIVLLDLLGGLQAGHTSCGASQRQRELHCKGTENIGLDKCL
jgi:hypothetical protein